MALKPANISSTLWDRYVTGKATKDDLLVLGLPFAGELVLNWVDYNYGAAKPWHLPAIEAIKELYPYAATIKYGNSYWESEGIRNQLDMVGVPGVYPIKTQGYAAGQTSKAHAPYPVLAEMYPADYPTATPPPAKTPVTTGPQILGQLQVKPGATNVNVRSTGSSSGSVVGTVNGGYAVSVTANANQNGYVQILSSDGKTGYIHSDYLVAVGTPVTPRQPTTVTPDQPSPPVQPFTPPVTPYPGDYGPPAPLVPANTLPVATGSSEKSYTPLILLGVGGALLLAGIMVFRNNRNSETESRNRETMVEA